MVRYLLTLSLFIDIFYSCFVINLLTVKCISVLQQQRYCARLIVCLLCLIFFIFFVSIVECCWHLKTLDYYQNTFIVSHQKYFYQKGLGSALLFWREIYCNLCLLNVYVVFRVRQPFKVRNQ